MTGVVDRPLGTLSLEDLASRSRRPRAGRPLAVLYLGFPLWWTLGLTGPVFFAAAAAMAIGLRRHRPLRVPPGFGLWLLFLAWMSAGVFLLWADAPGTVPEASPSRLVAFAVRAGWYLVVTVAMLYVLNTTRQLPTERVVRLLGWMFVVTAGFGVAAVLFPGFRFPSPTELLLPQRFTSSQFVDTLIHPALAVGSDFLGYERPRPTAPFVYSNSWGNNLALYLPFFVYAWFGPQAGWRRQVGPFVLAAAAVPTAYSLNRGMWLAVVVAGVYVALRLAVNGRIQVLQILVAVVLVAGAAFAWSPLYDTVALRLQTPHSNERRTSVATEVVALTARGSPIVGYGSTRTKQGSYSSLAGGETPRCHQCAPPPLGTQGFLWRLVLTTGFVGTALAISFLGVQFLRRARGPDPLHVTACATLLIGVVCFAVYDSLGSALFTMMVAVALLAREPGENATGAR